MIIISKLITGLFLNLLILIALKSLVTPLVLHKIFFSIIVHQKGNIFSIFQDFHAFYYVEIDKVREI